MTEHRPARGAIIRLFGVILIFLGMLDSMLSWRAGMAVSDFVVVLFAAGAGIYALGAIRGRRRTSPSTQASRQ